MKLDEMTLEHLINLLCNKCIDVQTEHLKGDEFITQLNAKINQIKQEILSRFNELQNVIRPTPTWDIVYRTKSDNCPMMYYTANYIGCEIKENADMPNVCEKINCPLKEL